MPSVSSVRSVAAMLRKLTNIFEYVMTSDCFLQNKITKHIGTMRLGPEAQASMYLLCFFQGLQPEHRQKHNQRF